MTDALIGVLGAIGASWTFNTGLLSLVTYNGSSGWAPGVWASATVRTVFLIVAIWRVSYMLVMEDGPWAIIDRLRCLRGTRLTPNHEILESRPGTAWACINCMSVWTALWMPFLPWQVIAVLAITGSVIWFRRRTIG